jgi:UDP:flavonoid glycosyltransferase YjiC (YdhE family)
MTTRRSFLIASWDGGGNTPGAVNLGRRLRATGHRVSLIGWASMAERVRSAGVDFQAYPSMAPWPADRAIDESWARTGAVLASETARDDILRAAADLAADVLVVDCMMPAALAAARRFAGPTVVLVHVLYAPYVRQWGPGMFQTDLLSDFGAADLVLALTPPGLDQPVGELPANTSYVGPIGPLPVDPAEMRTLPPELHEPGDPWVLLSLSTTLQGQTAALPTLLDAVGSLPVRVLLTLGGVLPVDAVRAPANVSVAGFLPHETVLPRMAAVLGHGGLSTITSALAFGVPLVCVPQGRDQGLNAVRVEEVGAGRWLPADASATAIAGTVAQVLADPAYRTVAEGFATATRDLGHGAVATELVATLAG